MRQQTEGLQLAPHQPLMAAGVTSAQSVRIATSLSQQLRVALSPVDIFNYPTIASLAEHLASQLGFLEAPVLAAPTALACNISNRVDWRLNLH